MCENIFDVIHRSQMFCLSWKVLSNACHNEPFAKFKHCWVDFHVVIEAQFQYKFSHLQGTSSTESIIEIKLAHLLKLLIAQELIHHVWKLS